MEPLDYIIADNINRILMERAMIDGVEITGRELARLAKLNPNTVSRVLTKRQTAGRYVIYAIANVLGVDPIEFYKDTKNQALIRSPTLPDVVKLLAAYQNAAEDKRSIVKLALQI